MPNTKSAERRMRNSERKHNQNKSTKSRLKTLEKNFLASVKAGKKEDATHAFRAAVSGFDKAAKTGAIHSATASRKNPVSAHAWLP